MSAIGDKTFHYFYAVVSTDGDGGDCVDLSTQSCLREESMQKWNDRLPHVCGWKFIRVGRFTFQEEK
jgi:hypothetical protein